MSYITDALVKEHTNRDGLKEILERTDVKCRMIRWILLLQEFELQIIQRKEEPPNELKRSVSIVYIPPGTIKLDDNPPHLLCNCFNLIGNQVMHLQKKKKLLKLVEINSTDDPT
jgi:hypothetical protein